MLVCPGLKGFLGVRTFHFQAGQIGMSWSPSAYMRFEGEGDPKSKEKMGLNSEWKSNGSPN